MGPTDQQHLHSGKRLLLFAKAAGNGLELRTRTGRQSAYEAFPSLTETPFCGRCLEVGPAPSGGYSCCSNPGITCKSCPPPLRLLGCPIHSVVEDGPAPKTWEVTDVSPAFSLMKNWLTQSLKSDFSSHCTPPHMLRENAKASNFLTLT